MLHCLSILSRLGNGGPNAQKTAFRGHFDGPVLAGTQHIGSRGPVSFHYFRMRDSVYVAPTGTDDYDLGSDGGQEGLRARGAAAVVRRLEDLRADVEPGVNDVFFGLYLDVRRQEERQVLLCQA